MEVSPVDQYVTGAVIRDLRKQCGMTQLQLAHLLDVSDKTVSKWETGRGYPDITLLEPIADAFGVSVTELISGNRILNQNVSADMMKSGIYVCPVCGNVIQATGEAVVICCGITLPPLETEEADPEHIIHAEITDDEYYVTADHPMTKEHYISFLAAVSDQGVQFIKLYPEGNAEARFRIQGVKKFYAFCNHHGLYELKAPSRPRR